VLKFEKIPFSAKNRVIMHKQTATDIKSQMQKQTAFIPVMYWPFGLLAPKDLQYLAF
jgi:hypothetical protein